MDEREIQELLAAIRKVCSTDVWSRAVELARSQAVFGESENDEEIKLRVQDGAGLVTPCVVLWPQDADWWCDCSSTGDGCVHAAAAIIALRRARQSGQALPGPRNSTGRLSYRFTRTAAGLSFERFVVAGERDLRVEGTLSAFAAAMPDLQIALTQEDVAVELAAGVRASAVIPPLVAPRMLEVLAACPDVRLDGSPVKASGPCAPFRAVIEDCEGGFRVRIEQNPAISEVFANAMVRCGASLHALGDSPLNAREIEELRAGRVIDRERVAALLTELMPSLQERLPLHIAARKLPRVVSDVSPHIALETRRDGDRLWVLPTIVYGDPVMARLDGDHITHLSGAVPLRHKETEQRLSQQLEESGLIAGRRGSLPAQDAIALMERIEAHKLRDVQLAGEGRAGFHLAPALSAKLKVSGDSFDLRFECKQKGKVVRADAGAVMKAWSSGEPLVALSGGGFAPLPSDWLARYGTQIADLIAAREISRSEQLPPSLLPDLARLCEALELSPPPGFDRLRALAEGFDALPHAPLPADFSGELRSYQRTGVDWLCFLREAGLGAMLADDMGLGKTVQALCAIRGRTLVVAPTSVLHNWADEISRFRPGVRSCRYHGAQRALDPGCDVVITTYAILRLDLDQLAAESWDTVVLDEAQAIKNPESQVAGAALRLRAQFRMTLTGTPVENRLDELWSQMNFLNPGLLGGRSDFQQRYARPIGEGEPGAAPRLRDRIRPFVLRRLKSEVAPELPPRTEVVLRCTLSDEERAVYEAIRAASIPGVVERLREGAGVFAALEALLRLRQACCHSALVPGQNAESSSKLELLVSMLDESLAGGHKALVFSQWTSLLDLLEPQLQRAGMRFIRLDGSTRDREDVVKQFQDEQGPPIMIISLKAGGTGLNLTAADHVYLLDPWWNPAVEDQAADRAHRIGQQRAVLVHRLVAEATVEEAILGLQQRKRAVADAALGEADQAAALTREDLLSVLG